MTKFAIVKTGGKQYIVREKDTLVVEKLAEKEKEKIQLETLAIFDDAGRLELGKPVLDTKTEAIVVSHAKGEKIRVAKFKAKVRYRRVTGFRPSLTTLEITKIADLK